MGPSTSDRDSTTPREALFTSRRQMQEAMTSREFLEARPPELLGNDLRLASALPQRALGFGLSRPSLRVASARVHDRDERRRVLGELIRDAAQLVEELARLRLGPAAGTMRRITRGLYDLPRTSPRLGRLAPSVDAVVKAVVDRDRVRVQPTGAHAAHKLGLTTQVPMRVSFLTDGPQRKYRIGKLTVTFRQTTPRNMATAGRASGLAIQALRWLGRDHVDDGVVRSLRRNLDADARRKITADLRYAPAWIADVLRRVTENGDSR
jgi:hypothetical protein